MAATAAPRKLRSTKCCHHDLRAVMVEGMEDVIVLNQELTNEWWRKSSDNVNLKKCGELLSKLKIALTKLKFLPVTDTEATKKELLIARNVLEVGATWSIAMKDIPSFERYMAQLKSYYLDYKQIFLAKGNVPAPSYTFFMDILLDTIRDGKYLRELEDSPKKYELLGLNLLCLLSQNRVAEFHTELELLPPQEMQTKVYINHPVSLEQYLMDGSYNKIFLAKGNVPAPSYTFFMDILLDTIRDEICTCMEKAYEKISLVDVAGLLKCTPQEIQAYGEKKGWKLAADGCYYFTKEERKVDDTIPSFELAKQAIEYARELEMIV